MKYISRNIDKTLEDWKESTTHKPLLLRGARQVGKSSAVRHLGTQFKYFAEVNFESAKSIANFFKGDLDVKLISSKISNYIQVPIIPGQTLLFLDEIQACPEAIMALRFFKEDYPELHVIAAGSLLEFALQSLPTFGVGRIHSVFMYPMTFDEFLVAMDMGGLLAMRREATATHPLDVPFHDKLVNLFRTYLIVGGMPEAVATWRETTDFLKCQQVHQDIILTYEDDFNKYGRRVNPELLRLTLHGVCHQIGQKLTFSRISEGYRSAQIREALNLLTLAGLVIPVVATSANGVPLDAESDEKRAKYLFLDSGLLLAILHLDGQLGHDLIKLIMTATPQDLVNKGSITEMVAGLEISRYKAPVMRPRLFYWEKTGNSIAEIDYLSIRSMKVLPIEIKAGTQGGMKSLWIFMREKHLNNAVRCSLENFGSFDYIDHDDDNAIRHVDICPLYALSQLS
ncbi:ATP-binding protein [Prevotella sp. P2-180]|uniref:ATP-binding protein n=1 Tax=Prevotella sp. P2-180 TaxID=2024224 RepID=UPI000B971978|nr:AAA family ATPase [Prevotella sp. P2-180]OYP67993.1 ATP-binding protein [Prevotella sp. P2-180]